MNRYIIKATYLTGPHKGSSYFLIKRGYVTDHPDDQWEDNCYKTENICKRVCKKMEEDSRVDHFIESRNREKKINEGKEVSSFMIHELMSYEPYFVKTVHPASVY